MALPDPNQIADVMETVTNIANDSNGKFHFGKAIFVTFLFIVGCAIWNKDWIATNLLNTVDPVALELKVHEKIKTQRAAMLRLETPKILSRINSIVRADLIAAYEYIPRGTDRYSSILNYAGRLPDGVTPESLQKLKNDKTSPVHINHTKGLPYPIVLTDAPFTSEFFDGMTVYTCPMYGIATDLRGFIAFYWQDKPVVYDMELYYVECNDAARTIGQYM